MVRPGSALLVEARGAVIADRAGERCPDRALALFRAVAFVNARNREIGESACLLLVLV
jgi:hypothetical protein